MQAVKASKVKPPGPGRGRGPRKSKAGQEDLSMGEGGELDDYDDEELGDGDMPGQGDQSVLVDVGGDEDGEDGG